MGWSPVGIGPGYIKLGPWSVGPLGIGCLLPFVVLMTVAGWVTGRLRRIGG